MSGKIVPFPSAQMKYATVCELHCSCGVDGYLLVMMPDPHLAQAHCPRCGTLHDIEEDTDPPRAA